MEFHDVVRRRRMVRSFEDRPVPATLVDRLLDDAVRAPSAGFTQGWGFLVLDEPDDVERFWAATWHGRDRSSFRWPGLFRAPVIVVPCSDERAYLDRYAEADKGWLDRDPGRWPVPYWHIDTAFAVMLLLLGAVDAGLGALFFGIFGDRTDRVRETFAIPHELTPIGAVALGWPAPDQPSPSLKRGRRPRQQVVHRRRWQEGAR